MRNLFEKLLLFMIMSLYSIFPFPDYVVYAVPAARMIVSSIIHDANTPFDKHYDNGSMSLVNY